jgi:hypothetical protein
VGAGDWAYTDVVNSPRLADNDDPARRFLKFARLTQPDAGASQTPTVDSPDEEAEAGHGKGRSLAGAARRIGSAALRAAFPLHTGRALRSSFSSSLLSLVRQDSPNTLPCRVGSEATRLRLGAD